MNEQVVYNSKDFASNKVRAYTMSFLVGSLTLVITLLLGFELFKDYFGFNNSGGERLMPAYLWLFFIPVPIILFWCLRMLFSSEKYTYKDGNLTKTLYGFRGKIEKKVSLLEVNAIFLESVPQIRLYGIFVDVHLFVILKYI